MNGVRQPAMGVRRMLPPLAFTAFVALVAAASIESLVARARIALVACDAATCVPPRLGAAAFDDLAQHPPGVAGYVGASTALAALGTVIPIALGVLVAVRGDGAWRWFVATALVALGFDSTYSSWSWAHYTVTPLGLAGWFWLVALFPTMSLVPRWSWIPAVAATAWAIAMRAVPAIDAAITAQRAPWYQLVGPGFLTCVAALIVAQAVRFRRSDAGTRRAQGQLLVGLAITLVAGAGGAVMVARGILIDGAAASLALQAASIAWLSVGLVVASAGLRDRVYGVRSVVDNVLAAAVLVVGGVAVFASVAGLVSLLIPLGPATAVGATAAAVVLAVAFQPIRRGIERLVYGDQDAASVVTVLTARVASAPSGARVLGDLLDELCARMRWPGARFIDADDQSTEVGRSTRRSALSLGDEVGMLEVGLRPGQRRLSRRDRGILRATSGAFAAALSVARLTETADDARRETMTARERERASLRRRLHDGVGPSLAVARHLVQGVRDDLPVGTSEQRTLGTADAALSDALEQVRRISRELRPGALDTAGFASAVRRFATDLGIAASVSGDDVDTLPEEVRVALYRVAIEALVNAQRHGSARRADVVIARSARHLDMTISDDGIGVDPRAAIGVGILSMRERTADLGGTVDVRAGDGHGTLVAVRLPIGASISCTGNVP